MTGRQGAVTEATTDADDRRADPASTVDGCPR
jgi:hypothetical protein